MGTSPPNWQWCQDASEDNREKYLESTGKGKLRTIRKAIKKSQVETVEFYDDIPEPTSKRAICVIPANDLAMNLLRITRDGIKAYAEKCGADYIELSEDQHPNWPMANKYRLHHVTSKYEKTLYLDCDVFVRPESPDLFEITPDDKISAYDEWELWVEKKDLHWIQQQQDVIVHKILNKEERDNLLDNGRFVSKHMINGGVMVIPQALADYYKQPDRVYPRHWCFDQNYLSVLLPDEKFYPLDRKWNLEYVSDDFFDVYEEANFIHVNNLKNETQLRVNILHTLVEGNQLIDINRFDKIIRLGHKSGENGEKNGYDIEFIETESLELDDPLPEKKSNYAICVINTSDYTEQQLGITRDRIVQYAERCGADYIELKGDQAPEYPMYNKYRLYAVTSVYEKTLYLDCDIVIQGHAPNIFLETPDDQISAHMEYPFLIDHRIKKIVKNEAQIVAKKLDLDDFTARHINGGVLVIPQVLADRYKLPDYKKIPQLWCFDQILLGFELDDDEIYPLGNKWNCSFKHTSFDEYHEHAYFLHLNNPKSTRVPALNWYANKKIEGLYTEFGCVPTVECAHHRSGWNQVCMQLLEESSDNGIYIDCFLENAFAWKKEWYEIVSHIPFTMPWLGFFHNPPNCPPHFLEMVPDKEVFGTIDGIISSEPFRKSMDTCRGLLTLSSYLADYLHEQTGLPTMSLKHPISDFPFPQWDVERAKENQEVCMIGYWYRKFENFIRMTTTYQKSFLGGNKEQLLWYLSGECREFEIPFTEENYKVYPPLTVTDYDDKLTESVIFLDFWDTACNTSLLDCMARNTPVIIPRHPAVVEYLGEDYPLYFDSLSRANEIINNFNLIVQGHEHLKNMDKSDLTEDHFFDRLRNWSDYIKS